MTSNANTSGLEVVAWDSNVLDTFGGFDQNVLTRTPYVAKTGERVRSQSALVTAASAQARIDAAEARADRLAKALERQGDNMAFLLNHAPIVQHWYENFSTELADDRAALQQETQK